MVPFILGLLSSFSLPPYNLLIINFIVFPVLLFFLIINYKKSKITFFIIGWIFGFGYFISNLYWITNSLTFEEIFKPLIPFALIFIPLFLGIFYGFVTLICSFFSLKKNFSTILIFAIIFSSIEFVRSFFLGGFPWNLIAYSWTNYLNSLQILSSIGTYSFNLFSITAFLMPLILIFDKSLRFKLTSFTILIIILLSNHYYGVWKIKQNKILHKENTEYKIKVVSPKIPIKRFFSPENPEEIIKELIDLSNPNHLEKTIFIFPEGILSSIYLRDLQNFKNLFSGNYSDNHILLMGINTKEKINDKIKIYNSLVVLNKNIEILAKYNKNKLVPFGEFLPLENLFLKFGLKKITYGYQSFSPGNERKVIKINNFKFIPLICYEIIYSGKLLKENKDFDYIINISEDGWFGDSVGPYQHFSHSIFRSIEEGKNLIRSANSGISAYIIPTGEVISKIKSTEKGVIEINNFVKSKNTLFNVQGNKMFFYFLLIYISLFFFLKKKENR